MKSKSTVDIDRRVNAKCPKCGKMGIRSLMRDRVSKGGKPRCFVYRHGRITGPLGPGIYMPIECYQAITAQ